MVTEGYTYAIIYLNYIKISMEIIGNSVEEQGNWSKKDIVGKCKCGGEYEE